MPDWLPKTALPKLEPFAKQAGHATALAQSHDELERETAKASHTAVPALGGAALGGYGLQRHVAEEPGGTDWATAKALAGGPPPAGAPWQDKNSHKTALAFAKQDGFDIGKHGQRVPLDRMETSAVADALAHYPTADIQALIDHHINLELAGPNTPAKALPNGDPWPKGAAGYWDAKSHTIASLQSYSAEKGKAQREADTLGVISHEAAHAIDGIEGGGGTSSGTDKDPRFQQMYRDYVQATKGNPNGKDVIRPDSGNFAAVAPAEFFAEGAKEFVTNPGWLRQANRGLYNYEYQHLISQPPDSVAGTTSETATSMGGSISAVPGKLF